MDYKEIYDALLFLDRRCDGRSIDGQGFTKFDMEFGKSLAKKHHSEWTPKMAAAVRKMLQKYSGQLSHIGVDPASLPKISNGKSVELRDGYFILKFPYDPMLVKEIKELPPHIRGFNFENKTWSVTARAVGNPKDNSTKKFLSIIRQGFTVSDEAMDRLASVHEQSQIKVDPPKRELELGPDGFLVHFPYGDNKVFPIVEEHPGSLAVKAKTSAQESYALPPTLESCSLVKKLCKDFSFKYSNEVVDRANAINASNKVGVENSSAVDTEYEVPEFTMLHGYQRVAVEYVTENERVFICDQMGTGKTLQAIAAVGHNRAFPCVVICPASLKYNWRREIQMFFPSASVEILEGKKATGSYNADFTIVNYDILSDGFEGDEEIRELSKQVSEVRKAYEYTPGGIKKIREAEKLLNDFKSGRSEKKFLLSPQGQALKDMKATSLVVDESHYVKNEDAQRTRAVTEISSAVKKYIVLMTGTPVLSNSMELVAQLRILRRLDELGGWWGFVKNYTEGGGKRNYFGGIDLSGGRNLSVLNEQMRSKGFYLRRKKEDVLKDLPEKVYNPVFMRIENYPVYERAVEELVEWVYSRAYSNPDFLEEIKHYPKEEQQVIIREYAEDRAMRAEAGQAFVRLNVLRQIAAEGKMGSVAEWIENFLLTGDKLVVFAHHKSVVSKLVDHFGCPKIDGSVPIKERDEIVNEFQTGDTQLLVLNLKAGGVGLTLTAASDVAFIEYPWTSGDYEQAYDRIHRIGATGEHVRAWNLIAENTIEEEMVRGIDETRSVADAVSDGTTMKKVLSTLLGG